MMTYNPPGMGQPFNAPVKRPMQGHPMPGPAMQPAGGPAGYGQPAGGFGPGTPRPPMLGPPQPAQDNMGGAITPPLQAQLGAPGYAQTPQNFGGGSYNGVGVAPSGIPAGYAPPQPEDERAIMARLLMGQVR